MTATDQAAAVARLRRYYRGEVVYMGPDGDGNFTGDVQSLLPPEDDAEPIADPVGRRGMPTWLKAIGGRPCDADGQEIGEFGGATRPTPEGVRIGLTADRWLVIAARPVDESPMDRGEQQWPATLHDPRACIWVGNVRTRGHVRRLLAALSGAA